MTDERYIAIWDARAALCRAHGDEISADYWTEQAERLSDRIEAGRTRTLARRHCAPVSFYAKPANA